MSMPPLFTSVCFLLNKRSGSARSTAASALQTRPNCRSTKSSAALTRAASLVHGTQADGAAITAIEFEIEHADFTQAASDKHHCDQSDCLYRKRDGSPFMCNTCEQPTSVPAERLASMRIRVSPWNHDRIKYQDCQEPPS